MKTEKKVLKFIQHYKLFSTQDKIVVAISGGADSVALLHILHSLGYYCISAHCNFQLRGIESNRDENFVKTLSEKFQIPYYVRHFDTVNYAKEKGTSIEMAARELRYNWFYELAEELQAQVIATAHHADDNIETLLMNLIRRTGIKGLTGIPYKNGKVVRPLLNISRIEIEEYLQACELEYVVDSTNLKNDYQRNKIRNEILPLLEKINPATRQNLYNSIGYFQDTYDIYINAIEKIIDEISCSEKGLLKINIQKLRKQKHIQSILFEILQPCGFTSATIKQICDNIEGESGKQFFSDTYVLLRNRDELIIAKRTHTFKKRYFINEDDIEINSPLNISLKKIKYSSAFKFKTDKDKIYVDFSKIKFPLEIRHWQEGDTFNPFGMRGKKKLSDFFIDQKFSIIEKEQCLLLLSNENIVWVIGHRADDRFKINPDTKDILEISLK